MTELTSTERFRAIRTLVDNRDYWIANYSRALIHREELKRFKLTPFQRRVIASLQIQWQLSKLQDPNDPRRRKEEPVPVMGYDERDRIVVQQYSKDHPNNVHCWALGREGQPIDIKGQVKSLKDDRVVMDAPREW